MRIQISYPNYASPMEGTVFEARSPLAPGHRLRLLVSGNAGDSESLTVKVIMELDGDRIPIFTKYFSQDDLADAYEKAHHEHHGYDPRGLDPRTERTRLTP